MEVDPQTSTKACRPRKTLELHTYHSHLGPWCFTIYMGLSENSVYSQLYIAIFHRDCLISKTIGFRGWTGVTHLETNPTGGSFSMFLQSLGGHCWELGPSRVFLHLPTQRIKERESQNWGVPSMKWVKPWKTSRTKSQAYRSSILTQALESLEAQQQRDCGSGMTFVSECKMDFNIF